MIEFYSNTLPLVEVALASKTGTIPHGASVTKVLLVEDQEDQRRLVEDLLFHAGFEVRSLSEGRFVLRHLEEEMVDLVLTDLLMPEMDGLEVVQTLQMNHPSLLVMVMTGHPDPTLTQAAMRFGAVGALRRPFTRRELREALHAALSMPHHPTPEGGVPSV